MSGNAQNANFASVDIGSHTMRLLIARVSGGREIKPICTERRITRLAKNFQEGHTLKDASMEESLRVAREYAALMERHGVRSAACGATGVIRRAENGPEFLEAVRQTSGIPASIISESDEAYLSAKGILSVLPSRSETVLSFDLGGSSTEFLLTDAQQPEPLWCTSIFIGAATITERFLTGDPPAASAIEEAAAAIRSALAPAIETVNDHHSRSGSPPSFQLVGTAGTVTTLAAMLLKMEVYEPFRVNGLEIGQDWLIETVDRLAKLPLALRRGIEGLEAGREDIILGGALIVREILRGLDRPRLTVTDGGLLEGLLLAHIEKEFEWPRSLVSPLTWRLQTG